jgi:hypothetical protein
LIAESLPILVEVAKLRESGKLEPERAEMVKRQIIDSITKFGQAGVTIPEIERYTVYNPRLLMQPDRKLLVVGTIADASMPEDTTVHEDPEFQEYMERMAREFREERRGVSKGSEDADKPDDGDTDN